MTGHTHDGVNWAERLADLRRADALEADTLRSVATRLLGLVDPPPAGSDRHEVGAGRVVLDVGSGAGGMSAALATALSDTGGGRLVVVDAVPELLAAATAAARTAVHLAGAGPGNAGQVHVEGVLVDAASDELLDLVPAADLVWASQVLHHLPDQREGVVRLARLLARGGWLALAEGGLPVQCLPWDVGVGEPGLCDRLAAARNHWFLGMRTGMTGSVRLPVGWTRALADAALGDVTSFSFLVDHPAPPTDQVSEAVVEWLRRVVALVGERLDASDLEAVGRLLDPEDPAYVGGRDDVFLLHATTVHLGRSTSAGLADRPG